MVLELHDVKILGSLTLEDHKVRVMLCSGRPMVPLKQVAPVFGAVSEVEIAQLIQTRWQKSFTKGLDYILAECSPGLWGTIFGKGEFPTENPKKITVMLLTMSGVQKLCSVVYEKFNVRYGELFQAGFDKLLWSFIDEAKFYDNLEIKPLEHQLLKDMIFSREKPVSYHELSRFFRLEGDISVPVEDLIRLALNNYFLRFEKEELSRQLLVSQQANALKKDQGSVHPVDVSEDLDVKKEKSHE